MTIALLLFPGTMGLSLWASFRVKRIYRRFAEEPLISTATESSGVDKVLNAAALTYVAAFITSFAYFLWHILPFLTGRNSDE